MTKSDSTTTSPTASAKAPRRVLSTFGVVVLVVAAAAPLVAIVGNTPIALGLGNNGVAGGYILVTIVMLLFAVGYAAMARRVNNIGGFFTFIIQGLGRPLGVAAAYVAVLSYTLLAIGLAAAFSYFAAYTSIDTFGVAIPWQVWVFVAIAVTAFLGNRSIEVSAKVLIVLLAVETLALVVFDIAVLVNKGPAALPVESIDPTVIFGQGFGVMIMMAVISYIGFESAAVYGQETKNPSRSVPRALYVSLIVFGAFYFITSWFVLGGTGVANAQQTAADSHGFLFFNLYTEFVHPSGAKIIEVLSTTSLFASLLAIHNVASRYMQALANEGLLPASVGKLNRRSSPSMASAIQIVVMVVVVGIFAIMNADPYLNVAVGTIGVGTIGVITLLALTGLAIAVYFVRNASSSSPLRTIVAPAAAFVALSVGLYFIIDDYAVRLVGGSPVLYVLPWAVPIAAAIGIGVALWLRNSRAARYQQLSTLGLRESESEDAS